MSLNLPESHDFTIESWSYESQTLRRSTPTLVSHFKDDMKIVSPSIGFAFTIDPYILRYVLGQITPVSLMHKHNKMAAEVFLSCIVAIGVNNGLAMRNIAKKMLQKDIG